MERFVGGGNAAEDDGANRYDGGGCRGTRQNEDGLQIFEFVGGEF